jgi:hypothetical protein
MSNIWTKIWLKPREAIREALARPENKPLEFGLLAIGGILNGVSYLYGEEYAHSPMAWAVALAVGAISGIALIYIFSWMLAFVGKKFGGTAPTHTIFRASAWSNIINVWILPAAFIGVLLFPTDESSLLTDEAGLITTLISAAAIFIYCIGTIWWMFTYMFAIAEAQNISVWKAAANSIIASLLFIVPIVVLIVLVVAFSGSGMFEIPL